MARPRTPARATQIFIAMSVVLVPILLITWFFTHMPDPAVNRVDPSHPLAQARAQASYPVLAPAHLPEGWQCTRARWTPAGELQLRNTVALGDTWQLGYLTPAKMYIGLDQRDRLPEPFVTETTRQGRESGTSTVDGAAWTRYTSADGRTHALVNRGVKAVTIVSGDLPFEELEAFAGTLASG